MSNMSRDRVINPDGEGVDVPDVDAFLADFDDEEKPMVDLGGGMVVPLRELTDPYGDDDE